MVASALSQGWCPTCEHYLGGWWMGGTLLFWPIVVILAIGCLFWIIRRSRKVAPPVEDTPESVLRGRYDRGEIDQAEYLRTLAEIRWGGDALPPIPLPYFR